MVGTTFQIITPDNTEAINLIAKWYLQEWNIPIDTTVQKLIELPSNRSQFQVLMHVDGVPIATGGLYNHVGLLDREPRLKIYKNWLALVYSIPERRGKGYGALICDFIQNHANNIGLKDIYLFTHTAESLYKRLGWQELERLAVGDKDIAIMKMEL